MAAAMVLGAAGVWTGSVWLACEEAETTPAMREKLLGSRAVDTVRSRAMTGRPARQLRSGWTDAWEEPAAPEPLPMPLQGILTAEPQVRISRAADAGEEGGRRLVGYFAGQAVGRLREVRPAAQVFAEMVGECELALARLSR
jgi:NAD(P)H-dependent flavin oxidoreductase YrpB (nitropropane dioxygenase family)